MNYLSGQWKEGGRLPDRRILKSAHSLVRRLLGGKVPALPH
jgi:hypothetical protein